MPKNKMIKEKLNGMAWDIHDKLLKSGANVWGVVVHGEDDVEVYFDEDVVAESDVKTKIRRLKNPNMTEVNTK
jgi:hypothetical protein